MRIPSYHNTRSSPAGRTTTTASIKGTYVFFAQLKNAGLIGINKRDDTHYFPSGWYAYVGSAFNSGGLKSRLNRHFHGSGKGHWHIDFFRQGVVPHNRAWVSYQEKRLERQWAAVIQLMDGVTVPLVNFGNSDDPGKTMIPGVKKTRLFHLKQTPEIETFQIRLDHYFPGHDPVIEISLPI